MSAYYSSDEEVSWGPLTLREIKRDFKRPPLRKVKRRHTLSYTKGHINEERVRKIPDIQDKRDELLLENIADKCNVSGTSTQYFTSNETFTQCTTENSSPGENQLHEILGKQEYNLDNYRLTLVDNISKDSLNHYTEESCVEEHNENNMNSNSVIVLSSDDSFESESFSYKENEIELKRSSICSNILTEMSNLSLQKDSLSVVDVDHNNVDVHDGEGFIIPCESKLDSKNHWPENVHNYDQVNNLDVQNVEDSIISCENELDSENHFLENDDQVVCEYSNSTNDSNKSEDGQCLDTTMDEIERLLNFEPMSPLVVPTCPSVSISKSHSQIPLPTKLKSPFTNDYFKVPQQTTSRKLITPKQKLVTSSNLKNIKSPVGLYIKYSPQPNLKLNMYKTKESKITHSQPVQKITPQKSDSLPKKIYKPSTNSISTSRKNLFLPPSIAKLVKAPQSTKHEGRLNPHCDDSQVEDLLSAETNLTTASIDENNLNATNTDISILVDKDTIKF